MDLFKEVMPSIYLKTKHLLDDCPDLEKEYQPYIVNHALSFGDTLFFANEMNKYPNLPKKLQYDFYFYAIPKEKRFNKWIKKEKFEHLDLIKRYYGYSTKRAVETLSILTEAQIELIKERTYRGEQL